MERRPTRSELAVASIVLLAVVTAGVGLAPSPESPTTWTIQMPADSSGLQQWSAVAASTVGLVGARLQPMTASASTILAHAPEVLLVVELGLLVEHLRLLHRVSDELPHRADAGQPVERSPPEERGR